MPDVELSISMAATVVSMSTPEIASTTKFSAVTLRIPAFESVTAAAEER